MAATEGRKIFQKFEKTSRAENIYEVIKEGILHGIWKPGDKINDQELAEELGVSRLSVREALSKFVENRIVEKRHWKGYQVRKLEWAEIEGIMEVRMALESLAIEHVSKKITPEILKELEDAITISARDTQSGDRESFRNSDYTFHEILYREAGNIWIVHVLENLRILIEIIRQMSQGEHFPEVSQASIEEHRKILGFLADGDTRRAVESLQHHIKKHTERVRMEFEANRTEESESKET